MLTSLTVQEAFLKNIESGAQAGITFIEDEGRTEYITYKKLYVEARFRLYELQQQGLQPGDELVFQFMSNKHFLVTFWACLFGKIIPVPVVFGVTADVTKKITNIWKRLKNPYLITDLPTLKQVWKESYSPDNETVIDIDNRFLLFEGNTYTKQAVVLPSGPSELAFVQFSSGSTGEPKGVTNTQESIIYNINTMSHLLDIQPTDKFLGWMPLTHDLGLVFFHLLPLLKNLPQFLVPPMVFFSNPNLWLKSLAKHAITVSGSPNFGYRHALDNLKHSEIQGLSFNNMRVMINGAEMVSVDHCREFEKALSPYGFKPRTIIPSYGLAEAVLGVAIFQQEENRSREVFVNRHQLKTGNSIAFVAAGSPDALSFACVGPYTGTEIKITGDQMNTLPEHSLGLIHLKSKAITSGFYNDEISTQKTISEDGWLNTGDLGFISQSHLFITGRAKEMILINGQNYFPTDIDDIIEELPEIRFQQAISCNLFNEQTYQDDILVFLLYQGAVKDFVLLEHSIKEHVAERIGLWIKRVIAVDRIPRTTSGKIQRYILLQHYLQGKYNHFIQQADAENELLRSEAGENSEEQVKEKLLTIWEGLLEHRPIGLNDHFFRIGGNSMAMVRLISRVHKSLGVQIDIKEAFDHNTIEAQAQLIARSEKVNFSHIEPAPENEYYPQSGIQKRMFILSQLNPGITAYNVPACFKVDGHFDAGLCTQAFREIINRHEALRTSFHLLQDNPVQKIHDAVPFSIELVQNEHSGIDALMADFIRPFDLSTPPLIRVGIKQEKNNTAFLLIDMHHIITDGVSYTNLMRELAILYNNGTPEPLNIQYKDYAVWQLNRQTVTGAAAQRDFWLAQFKNIPEAPNLPADFQRPQVRGFAGATTVFELTGRECIQLKEICDSQGTTMYMLLLASLSVLVSKLSGLEDITLGTSTEGRAHMDAEKLIGVFINTLPVRNFPKGNQPFATFLATVKDTVLKCFANQEYTYEQLTRGLGLVQDMSRNPLFDIMFEYYNYNLSEFNIGEARLSQTDYLNTSSKLDLSFRVFEKENSFVFYLDYSTGLFKQETIARFIAYFRNILAETVKNINISISDINMLPAGETDLLRNRYNATALPYAKNSSLVTLFEEQAAAHPGNIAVCDGKRQLSYQELNEQANKVANYLLAEGILPGNIVGLLFERSLDMIIAIWGVLKAGGAYLPIDPTLPGQRINYMLNQSQAALLLCQEQFLDAYTAYLPAQKIDSARITRQSSDNVQVHIQPADLAYCIFTSGSSGKPKGVMMNHQSVINLVKGLEQHVYARYENKMLHVALVASFSFDASVQQIYGCLLQGHSLYIADDESRGDGKKLNHFYEVNDIDLSDGTPTHLRILTEALPANGFVGKLSAWILAGEVLPKELVKEFYSKTRGQVQVYNFYGPTETCVDSTGYKVSQENLDDYPFIPIGKPLPNERVYITDAYGKLVPVGVVGELCIAGDGLAQRYIGDEATTSEKFRDDWIEGEERVYRTGDMARWLPDGNLEYRGRIDSQVKLRGYRIELSEIENQLGTFTGINNCAADLKSNEYDKFLVAYYESPAEIDVTDLRHYLSQSLPDYMIPSYFVWVEKLPLTTNGKVNRNELPAFTFKNTGNYIPPCTETEKKLVTTWAEVLKLDEGTIGIDHDFFNLGGQSLKLVFLANRIREVFNTPVSLVKLAALKTIREQAKEINASAREVYFKIEQAPRSDFYPLSYAQRQFYFLNLINSDSTVYNQPQAFLIKGDLNVEKLKYVLQQLIAHHESFRTAFKLVNDSPVQYVLNDVPFELECFSASPEESREIISTFIRPFSLNEAPLLRAGLIQTGSNTHILVIDRHHIVSDGIGLNNFVRDFTWLYQGMALPPAGLQYKDYAVWQQGEIFQKGLEEQGKYWNQVFSTPPDSLMLRTDFERPPETSYRGAEIDFVLNVEQTQMLNNLAKSLGITLHAVFLGMFKILLYKLTGQNDLVVGMPASGRRNTEIENIIGVFINVLAIRSEVQDDCELHHFLDKVHQNTVTGLEHQEYPYEKLVADLGIATDINRNPLFDVMFVYREEDASGFNVNGLAFESYTLEPDTSQMDLMLHINVTRENIFAGFQYATDLFHKTTIEKFIRYFRQIISQATLDLPVKSINILDSEEAALVGQFSNPNASFEIKENIVELFQKQALLFPGRNAVVFGETCLTYKELDEKSNQLAAYLAEQGVTRGNIIGLMVNRSAEMITGILGILKSGAAYLPVDHMLPFERIRYMLQSSNAKLLLGHQEHIDAFRDIIDVQDINTPLLKNHSVSNLDIERSINDVAYCIFTSGSTGTPKGVLMEDKSIVNLVGGLSDAVYKTLGAPLRVGLIASYSFDASCQQIYSALLNGHSLYIAAENERMDGGELYNFFAKNSINISDGTPTHFGMFLNALKPGAGLPGLKAWLLAGEVLPRELVSEFYNYPALHKITLYNLYGPTETCVDSTCYKISAAELNDHKTIPIGRPLPNERIYIVDAFGNPVPAGIIGELCIAGDGLARGYIGNTAENNRFVQNWVKGEDRVYRTGDRAYWLPDGNISYQGRVDDQVKLRGYRIEPGEVEQVLLAHNAISESAVVLKNIDGAPYLVAYYMAGQPVSDDALREYLSGHFPDYMVPSFYVHMNSMPVTANGKLNRNALPVPDRTGNDIYSTPSSETEKKLAVIWAEVLRMDTNAISTRKSFMHLGGNSLLAIQVASKIRREFDVELKLVDLFKKNTILLQANFIDASQWLKSDAVFSQPGNKEITI